MEKEHKSKRLSGAGRRTERDRFEAVRYAQEREPRAAPSQIAPPRPRLRPDNPNSQSKAATK